MMYFYGTDAHLSVDKCAHSVCLDVHGEKHGVVYFEDKCQYAKYKSQWHSMKAYKKELLVQLTVGAFGIDEYKLRLKKTWLGTTQ